MPSAPEFEVSGAPFSGETWRMVEYQSQISTRRLVDNDADHAILEDALEASKPNIPAPCQHLHYLLSTPFRYGCYPRNTRFRRQGETPGVYYSARASETAVAEDLWYLLKFYRASPETPLPKSPMSRTAIRVSVSTRNAINLQTPPFSKASDRWTNPENYEACLNLADDARAHGIELIRYASVRHPDALENVAVLDCKAFSDTGPTATETWHYQLAKDALSASLLREFPHRRISFEVTGPRLSFGA